MTLACGGLSPHAQHDVKHLNRAFTSNQARSADLQVTKHFEGDLDASKKYVFAYMPHGLYPAGAAYMSLLTSRTQCFPGIAPVVLTATIMHWVPILRDFLGWSGSRSVRTAAFSGSF